MNDPKRPVVGFAYVNHRGQREVRRVQPLALWFGSTQWHPEPQFLLKAFDLARNAERDFAMAAISEWSLELPLPRGAPPDPLVAVVTPGTPEHQQNAERMARVHAAEDRRVPVGRPGPWPHADPAAVEVSK